MWKCVTEIPLISQWLPAKSGAALRYGPWSLIWVQMIDSLEGKMTGLALRPAVTTLSHSVTRQGSKEKNGESNKSTSGAPDGGNRRKRSRNQQCRPSCQNTRNHLWILNVCLYKKNRKPYKKKLNKQSGIFEVMKKTGKRREQVWQCREERK